MSQEGGGKFIKESYKKDGVYQFKYEEKSVNVESRLHLLSKKIKKIYSKIDLKNDDNAGIKLEKEYNKVIGKEIDNAKKTKENTKNKELKKELQEYLNTLKERYPVQYENYNVQIKNKFKAKLRKSKSLLKM